MPIIDTWTVDRTVDGVTVTQKVELDQSSGYRSIWVTSDYAGKQVRYYVGRAISDASLDLVLRLQGLAKA